MKEFFKDILSIFNDFEINNLKEIVLAFSFIKFADSSLRYSKADIVNQYKLYDDFNDEVHASLLNRAKYRDGKELGFYNYSDWDLDKLNDVVEESISKKFNIYLNSFSDNINSLLVLLKVSDFIDSIDDESLYFLVNDLNNVNLDEDNFNSYENLNKSYNLFLIEYANHFDISTYISFINSVFMDRYYNPGNNVLVDVCDDAMFINDIDEKYDGHIYLNERNRNKSGMVLSRLIIANRKLSKLIDCDGLSASSFDLIISNDSSINPIGDVLKDNLKKMEYAQKIIFTVSSDDINECLSLLFKSYEKDILEAVITLPIYEDYDISAIVLNNNKKENLKGSFLLINEYDLLADNRHVSNWKFIILKLSNIIKMIYSDPQKSDNLIQLKWVDDIPSKSDLLFNEDSKGLTKRKRMRYFSNEYSHTNLSDDIDVNEYVKYVSVNISKKRASKPIGNNGGNIQKRVVEIDVGEINNEKDKPDLDEFIKDASSLIEGDIEIVELSQIAKLTIPESLNEDSLYILNCDNFNEKLAFFGYELTDFDCADLIEIELKSEVTALKYLSVFLNSKTGLNELKYATKGYYNINPTNLGNARVVIPDMVNQIFIVNAYEEGEEFLKSINNMMDHFQENIFDYKKMINSINEFRGNITLDSEGCEVTEMSHNWRYVYSGLIWPLAITYLSATRGGYENTGKARKYLILFEFIAAFNSIVLLSGLPDEVYEEFKWSDIWKKDPDSGYRNINFGDWRFFSKDLSNLYKNNDFTTDFDRKLFDSISASKINSLIRKAHLIRNEYSHEGMMTPRQSELFLELLNSHLSEIFDILEVYSEYKLFYVLGVYEAEGDIIKNRVIHLNGPCKQPIYGYFDFDKMLPKEALFLYNPINKKLLRLKDSLIKFMPVDEFEKQWGIYIFNGIYTDPKGATYAKYKNFQEKDDEHKVQIRSFEKDIVG